MGRLTRIDKNGDVYITKTMLRLAVNRLAAYEDTGLEPDEIKASKWIPVSEQMPNGTVLACDTVGDMIVGYVYTDELSDTGFTAENDNEILYETIAWMPLPEPYKEEG